MCPGKTDYRGFEVACPLYRADKCFLSLVIRRRDCELLVVGLWLRRPRPFDESTFFLWRSTFCHVFESALDRDQESGSDVIRMRNANEDKQQIAETGVKASTRCILRNRTLLSFLLATAPPVLASVLCSPGRPPLHHSSLIFTP